MVRRVLSSIGTREGRKNRVENNSRNEDNKRRRKTKEEGKQRRGRKGCTPRPMTRHRPAPLTFNP